MAEETKKIVGRDVSPANNISWSPADGSFPMRYLIVGNRLGGTFSLVIGVGWISFLIDDIFKALWPAFVLPEFLMMALFILPGIFILIFGFSQFLYREETVVDQNSIVWTRRGLSGSRNWRESVSNYQGVLKEHQYVHGSSGNATHRQGRMNYFIRLLHADPVKEIVLYWAEGNLMASPKDWDEKWKRYAELLQLPVLEKTEDGTPSFDVGDLETPLIEKIREGKRKVSAIDPDRVELGTMAKLTREDDLWIITCYPVWNAWRSIAGVIVLAAALFGADVFGLINPQVAGYFLWSIPICVLAIGLSIRKQIARPEKLAIDKKTIFYRYYKKPAGWTTDDMPVHSITNISVKSNPKHFRDAADIVIESKGKTIRFGWWLSKETKLRIEKVVLSILAQSH